MISLDYHNVPLWHLMNIFCYYRFKISSYRISLIHSSKLYFKGYKRLFFRRGYICVVDKKMFQIIVRNNPIQTISFCYSKCITIILAWNQNKVYDRIRKYIQPCVYENMSFSCSRCWISIYIASRKNLFLLNCKHTWFIVRVLPANGFIWNVALLWATSIQFCQHICCCCSVISLAHIWI